MSEKFENRPLDEIMKEEGISGVKKNIRIERLAISASSRFPRGDEFLSLTVVPNEGTWALDDLEKICSILLKKILESNNRHAAIQGLVTKTEFRETKERVTVACDGVINKMFGVTKEETQKVEN